jgi:hypothetical protein
MMHATLHVGLRSLSPSLSPVAALFPFPFAKKHYYCARSPPTHTHTHIHA